MGYLSLTKVKSIFQEWATNDPNIVQYGYGDFWDGNAKPKVEQKYPGMFISPISTTDIQARNNQSSQLKRQFRVFFFDLVFNNIDEVHSTTEELALRFGRWLKNLEDEIELVSISTLEPFKDEWVDDVAGYTFQFELEFIATDLDCGDPENTINI